MIVGGGDSAFDWALTLSPLARSVTVVHRRETFRAHEALVRQVADLGVPVITSAELVAASGGGWIEAVDVHRKRTKETTRLKTQAVVAALASPPTSARSSPGAWTSPSGAWSWTRPWRRT